MFHVFKSRLCMTHAVKDCSKYVAIKGSSVQEFTRFSDFSRSHFTVSGQVIPTSQRGWRKWATGKTILCLSNTMSKSRYKHLTAFEQLPCDIPFYYMATIVRALWLAAERKLFSYNDRVLWNFFSAGWLFWVVSKTTCAWAKTTEKMDKVQLYFQ